MKCISVAFTSNLLQRNKALSATSIIKWNNYIWIVIPVRMSNASPNTGHARYTVNPGVVTSRLKTQLYVCLIYMYLRTRDRKESKQIVT